MERLCPACGEGLLRPILNSKVWVECEQCRRSQNLERLDEQERQAEDRRLTNEILQCMREDQKRGEPGSSGGAKGRKKEPKRTRGEGRDVAQPWDVDGGSDRATVTVAKKIRLTVRPSGKLQEIFNRLQITGQEAATAIRAAIYDFLFEG